jgi:hypothetical protein
VDVFDWLAKAENKAQSDVILSIYVEVEKGVISDDIASNALNEFFTTGEIPDLSTSRLDTIVTIYDDRAEASFQDNGLGEFSTGTREVWIDHDGNEHEILPGEPEQKDVERRQTFDDISEALDYVEEIGDAGGYFDIYYSAAGYTVYYMG